MTVPDLKTIMRFPSPGASRKLCRLNGTGIVGLAPFLISSGSRVAGNRPGGVPSENYSSACKCRKVAIAFTHIRRDLVQLMEERLHAMSRCFDRPGIANHPNNPNLRRTERCALDH